jgi:uncharacterized protein YhjY with autotransporter beta-barrel domain
MIGGGAPPALAACNTSYSNTTAIGCTNSTVITGIAINNSTITTSITNTGTISPNGVILTNDSTINGGIVDSGKLVGGVSIDSTSDVLGGTYGVLVGRIIAGAPLTISTFGGGITNSGTVSADIGGIGVGNTVDEVTAHASAALTISTFGGGITNSGTISGEVGIWVGGNVFASAAGGIASLTISTFGGGITNSGTISTSAGDGILVGGSFAASGAGASAALTISTFGGGITNGGAISADASGIHVNYVGTFSGAIVNAASGTITAAYNGIGLSNVAQFGNSSAGGGIVNAGMIAASNTGISVTNVSTFLGGITNSGTISAGSGYTGISVTGVITFAGGIVNAASSTITAGARGIFVSNVAQFGSSSAGGGIVNAGTISAGNTGIAVGGLLGVSTFLGGITNSGTINAGGPGILVNGVSTFSGGITNSGKIIAQTGIVVGTAASPVSTFLSGAIVNSGTITGTGGTAINIANGPAGMTINILGGAISGNILGSGTGSGDTVNFNLGAGNSFTYGNTISGVQTVAVNSGTLFDGGAITAGSVNVNAGGVLAPGLPNSVGTLNITGSLVFASSAMYLDTISGGNASRTAVTGAATLGGASVQIASGSMITAGTKYTILTDTLGGIGGSNTFAGAVSYNGQTGTLSYDADDVYLTFASAAVANLLALLPPNAPRNVVNVANGIDNFVNGGGGTLPTAFSNLLNLSGTQLQNALIQLDGEVETDAEKGAFALMNQFLGLMLDPFVDGRFGTGGGPIGFAPDQGTSFPPDIALAYASILKTPPKPTFDQRWTAWGSAFGASSTTNGNAAIGSNTVTAADYGFAAGMDYRATPNTVYGFALAGGGTNWNLTQGLGTGRSDAFQAGVYGKSYWGPAYVSAALAFTNYWFSTNRTALGDDVTARFAGQGYGGRLETGYRYSVPVSGTVAGVAPYAAIQTQWFHTPTYSETDLSGGGLGLAFNSMTANDTRSELGARFDDPTLLNGLPLILRARVAWAHDWFSNPSLDAVFQSLPGSSFIVNGATPPKNSALTSAGAQYFFSPAWSFTAKFDGEFASGSQTYGGTGTLRYQW